MGCVEASSQKAEASSADKDSNAAIIVFNGDGPKPVRTQRGVTLHRLCAIANIIFLVLSTACEGRALFDDIIHLNT
jgi:hypothetical protein